MSAIKKLSPMARAIGTVGVVVALAGGVTYAALSSQATLTGNTVASATASLTVDGPDANPNNNSTDFSTSEAGYTFSGVVPGGSPSTAQELRLLNAGDTTLGVEVTIPALPTWTGGTVDNSKVHVLFNCTGALTATFNSTIQTMWATGATLGPISNTTNGGVATCTAQVSMDSDAFSGSGVTSTGFDFVFTGTAQ